MNTTNEVKASETKASETKAKTEEVVTAPVTEKKPELTATLKARLKDGYERLAHRVGTELHERGKIGKKQWEDALTSAREFVQRSKPELKREDVEKVAEGVKKDVRQAVRTIGSRGEEFTRSESFLTARDKGAELLLRIATLVKDKAEAVETNLSEILKYKKGDVVGGGTFLCAACSESLTVESGAIPACPKCGKEEFKRKS